MLRWLCPPSTRVRQMPTCDDRKELFYAISPIACNAEKCTATIAYGEGRENSAVTRPVTEHGPPPLPRRDQPTGNTNEPRLCPSTAYVVSASDVAPAPKADISESLATMFFGDEPCEGSSKRPLYVAPNPIRMLVQESNVNSTSGRQVRLDTTTTSLTHTTSSHVTPMSDVTDPTSGSFIHPHELFDAQGMPALNPLAEEYVPKDARCDQQRM